MRQGTEGLTGGRVRKEDFGVSCFVLSRAYVVISSFFLGFCELFSVGPSLAHSIVSLMPFDFCDS